MIRVSSSDPALNQVTLACYDYPTALIHLPWNGRFANLRELALGLKTDLETRHAERSEVTLVGHSLGGLVVRQYIVSELKAGRTPLATKLLLYAVPNTGASLAAIASTLSWNHRHLKPLCRGSDVLEILNEDWINLAVEDRLNIRYVVGGADGIVTANSARPFAGRDNVSTLIGYDHTTIIQPQTTDDIRYATLRRFALGLPPARASRELKSTEPVPKRPADPLFDIYDAQDEPFYSDRPIDAALKSMMSGGHVWLSGASGAGKTTALRRCALSSGWRLQQIMLGGYSGRSAIGLMRAICIELADLQAVTQQPNADADPAELITFFRRTLRALPDDRAITILIEEIPIGDGPEFASFLRLVLMALSAIEADPNLNGRIQLAFSSINDATTQLKDGMTKLRERVQFVPFKIWTNTELRSLVDLLCSVTQPQLTDIERHQIVEHARGSPRYVKMVFRHLRNGRANESFSALLQLVAAEQV